MTNRQVNRNYNMVRQVLGGENSGCCGSPLKGHRTQTWKEFQLRLKRTSRITNIKSILGMLLVSFASHSVVKFDDDADAD